MPEARTLKEAYIAELLGDLDKITARIEMLPAMVNSAQAELKETVRSLDEAGERYRTATRAYTEQVKAELDAHIRNSAKNVLKEHETAIQEALKSALAKSASSKPKATAIITTAIITAAITAVVMQAF